MRIRPVDAHRLREGDEEIFKVRACARRASQIQLPAHVRPRQVIDPHRVLIIGGLGDRTGPGWAVFEAGRARADEPACEIVHAVQNGKTFRVAIDVGKFGQDVEKERRQIVC